MCPKKAYLDYLRFFRFFVAFLACQLLTTARLQSFTENSRRTLRLVRSEWRHSSEWNLLENILRYGTRVGMKHNIARISEIVTHQIFSLAHYWSKHVTWLNVPPDWGISSGIPQFSKNPACCEKWLKDNERNSLHLTLKICSDSFSWTLSVPWRSQFPSNFALGKSFASRKK